MSDFKLILSKEKQGADSRQFSLTDGTNIRFCAPGLIFEAYISTPASEAIWAEPGGDGKSRSFVVVFGWCYRVDKDAATLTENSMAEILRTHRARGRPDLDRLSGTFCLISFEHISQTLWICSDLWAEQSFFYGANPEKMAAAGRAAETAACLGAAFDAHSCLGHLRGSGLAPGRTLFDGVWRAMPGQAIKIDLQRGAVSLVQVQELRQKIEKISRDEAVDRMAEFVKKRVVSAAALPGVSIDLTGGADTRMTAAGFLNPEGRKIAENVAFKFSGPANNPDAVTAQKAAEICGFNFCRNGVNGDLAEFPEDLLHEAVTAIGGGFLPDPSILLWLLERRNWRQRRFLIGSIGGEFLRNQFWRHEFFKIGRTTKVDYNAFLKYRLYASTAVDLERVFDNKLSFEQNNEYLLTPYRAAEKFASGMLNAYKLDVMFQFKLSRTVMIWDNSDYRVVLLPYLSGEAAKMAMSLPWRMRNGRRLQTAVIEKLSPELSRLPGDAGAPMRPLRLSTAPEYIGAVVKDMRYAYNQHFKRKKASPRIKASAYIMDRARQRAAAENMFDVKAICRAAEEAGPDLTMPLYKEMQLLALVNMLCEMHPNIAHGLSCANRHAPISQDEMQLWAAPAGNPRG